MKNIYRLAVGLVLICLLLFSSLVLADQNSGGLYFDGNKTFQWPFFGLLKPHYSLIWKNGKKNQPELCWHELGTGKKFCEKATLKSLNGWNEAIKWYLENSYLEISTNPFPIKYTNITAISKDYFTQITCPNEWSDENYYCFKEKVNKK